MNSCVAVWRVLDQCGEFDLLDTEMEQIGKCAPEVFLDFLGMYGQQVQAGTAPIPGLTVDKPVDKTEWGTW